LRKYTIIADVKKLILDTKIMVVCQSACGSAGITANTKIGIVNSY